MGFVRLIQSVFKYILLDRWGHEPGDALSLANRPAKIGGSHRHFDIRQNVERAMSQENFPRGLPRPPGIDHVARQSPFNLTAVEPRPRNNDKVRKIKQPPESPPVGQIEQGIGADQEIQAIARTQHATHTPYRINRIMWSRMQFR